MRFDTTWRSRVKFASCSPSLAVGSSGCGTYPFHRIHTPRVPQRRLRYLGQIQELLNTCVRGKRGKEAEKNARENTGSLNMVKQLSIEYLQVSEEKRKLVARVSPIIQSQAGSVVQCHVSRETVLSLQWTTGFSTTHPKGILGSCIPAQWSVRVL